MTEKSWQYLDLQRDERILTVSINSGDKVNSLGVAVMRELTELAQQLQHDSDLSAIILCGREDIFSGGANLKDPVLAAARDASLAERRTLNKTGPMMCAAWEALEPITIVAIEGWCIGGGTALAVACDWRVAAKDAQLYVPELKLGMNMSWQSVPRFTNLIGPARAKQLLILCEPLAADTALAWGLVDYCVDNGQSLPKALALANQVAAMPPIPVRMIKRGITTAATALNNATSFMDADQFMLAQSTDDAREGPAAFFEKRDPEFKGN
jgi:enoyl-CoA hydratase